MTTATRNDDDDADLCVLCHRQPAGVFGFCPGCWARAVEYADMDELT